MANNPYVQSVEQLSTFHLIMDIFWNKFKWGLNENNNARNKPVGKPASAQRLSDLS